MAIDTAEKRKSVSGIPFLVPGVTPNANKDAEWRREVAWSYPFEVSAAAAGMAFLDEAQIYGAQLTEER